MSRETPPPTTGEPIQGFLSWIRDGDFNSGGNMVLTRGRHAAALAYRSAADCRPPFPALVAVMLGSLLLGCSPDLGDPPPAIGSSIRYTSRAPADSADSRTARFSTSVIPNGTQMIIRG